jgi:hypothetical protein
MLSSRIAAVGLVLLLTLACCSGSVAAQPNPPHVPPQVGVTTLDLVDGNRPDPWQPAARRELAGNSP